MLWDVRTVTETGSTNADLLALARAGASPGRVLRAGHQTAGRGRLGRSWEAPAGASLLVSVLLEAEAVPFFAVARAALALANACGDLAGVEPHLKWPNDLLISDRKLAGLLAETDGGSTSVVVGVGCNLTWSPLDSPPAELVGIATALSDHVAQPPSPEQLLDGFLARLSGWMTVGAGPLVAAYRGRCATIGRDVKVQLADRSFTGQATGLTSEGGLVVTFGGGSEVVHAGDVVHLRAN